MRLTVFAFHSVSEISNLDDILPAVRSLKLVAVRS